MPGPGQLVVSADGYHLEESATGHPFFWLADTVWLLHRLAADELTTYFRDRQRRRFTVVQGPSFTGWRRYPNCNGEFPFVDGDTDRPNASYWSYADEMIQEAGRCGLYMAPVVMWGSDYAELAGRSPRKPVIDSEALYEGHAVDLWADPGQPCEYYETADAHDIRTAAYRAVFAGACGHTYGHIGVWMIFRPGDVNHHRCHHPETDWYGSLNAPGATSMTNLYDLVTTRPSYEKRIPDQSLIRSGAGKRHFHRRACRAANGSWAMVYLPKGGRVDMDLAPLAVGDGQSFSVRWYDPRTGEWHEGGTAVAPGPVVLNSPSCGPKKDWVLVLGRAR